MRLFRFPCCILPLSCALLLLAGLTSCIEPTPPSFQLEEPFYLVEGEIADRPGSSEIRIRRSNFRSVQLEFDEVTDATVTAEEAGAGTQVQWEAVADKPGSYRPPSGFVVESGEAWNISVTFADGTRAVSAPEQLPSRTTIDDLRIAFDQEGRFDAGAGDFVPVFRLLIDFTDPADVTNYYEWDYRYWESIEVCASCTRGTYRNGVCIPVERATSNNERYDYLCESGGCYRETAGTSFDVSADQAFAGGQVRGKEIGNIEFSDYGGLLVEAIQYGITPEAYAYGKVIADLLGGSSGLNATIPAALNGNLRNLEESGEDVLGYVRVVTVASRRTYLLRDTDTGTPSFRDRSIRVEPSVGAFTPPRAPCAGNGRSPEKPEGWP